jgi:Flp pilus assembly protein TadD
MKTAIDQAIAAHQEGKLIEAEKLYREILKTQPKLGAIHCNLGSLLYVQGRFNNAEVSLRKAIELKPDFAEAHNNLGNTLKDLGRLNIAEASYRKAIELKPDFAQAHNNLGILLIKLHRFDEAEASYRKAIELNPNHSKAHNNLGNVLIKLHRSNEAEASYRKAIELKPNFALAHNNLGNTLFGFDRFDEAETSYRKAIELNLNYSSTHNNLGNVLLKLNRFDEAEASYRKAIELKADFVEAHNNLGILLIENKLRKIIKIKRFEKKNEVNFSDHADTKTSNNNFNKGKLDFSPSLIPNPFITKRNVEEELVASLYKIKSKKLDEVDIGYLRYGNGRSSDYKLFENDSLIIKNVAKDLIKIMKDAVKSDILVSESFFNIFQKNSGIAPHAHIRDFDNDNGLVNQKYSLVYYLSVGDQNCSEPGILKLYDPDEEILPSDSMVMIFPASRRHSAVYDGKEDRVMIGVNFYSLF